MTPKQIQRLPTLEHLLTAEQQRQLREDLAEMARRRRRAYDEAGNVVLP